jgi:cyclopropane-fatty-acyl-phospholipid synthase
MNDTTLIDLSRRAPRRDFLAGFAREQLFSRLARLRRGHLRVCEPEGHTTFAGDEPGPHADLVICDPAFHADVAFGGSVGAGESYMAGHWRSSDLTALLRLLLANRELVDAMDAGVARFAQPLLRAAHALRRNTRAGARRNISAHYDLGNEFFAIFLDETLMYSCALFEREGMTLAEASRAKLDLVCRKLALSPDDHVLEIGSGWGGFALHAATRFGCRVTTTTLSPNQRALALERIRAAGLSDRVEVLLEDYRDLKGRFDKLVSIEMIEAIGHAQYETFFAACSRLLAPRGRMLLQSITIADRRYDSARRDVDFIKRYIFPGCCIPALAPLTRAMARASDLGIVHLEDIGPHYAETLARWRSNFLANEGRVAAMGYPEEFRRMWEFYFAYCEAGFAERALGNVQMLLERPP